MDLKQLRSFVALVDCRNFSRAAEKLKIAQSSVSTHLAQLEKELGARLLNRTTKTIEVTGKGWQVYRYASQILELEEDVRQTCSGNGRQFLRISASAVPATYILPGVLQQYKALFPHDCLKIKECESKAVIDGVLDYRFDAGLTEQMVRSDKLVCTRLCRNQPILITPATEKYLQMKHKGTPAAELLKESVILCQRGADLFPDQMGIDLENLNTAARVNDFETVKNMVSSGLGVSVIPEVAALDFLKAHRLLAFELPHAPQFPNIYLVYPEGCTSKDRVWNFVDYLLEYRDLLNHI